MEKRQKLLHVRNKSIHDVFITDACIYDERKRRKRRKTAVTVRGDSRRGMGQPKYHIFFSLSFYYGTTLSFNVKFAQFTLSRLYLTPPICSEDRVVWKFDEKWKAVCGKEQQTDKWVRFEGNERRAVADGPEELQILWRTHCSGGEHHCEHFCHNNRHLSFIYYQFIISHLLVGMGWKSTSCCEVHTDCCSGDEHHCEHFFHFHCSS